MDECPDKTSGCGGVTFYIKVYIYIDVPMEWVDFFSFDIYDWVVDLSLQYINGW